MRILFLTTAHNGLSQGAYLELTERGHEIELHIANSKADMEDAVNQFKPDLIIAPYLKKVVPENIWKNHTVLIVHPGIKGDRGPSSLDWAIMDEHEEWGVTVLQAEEEMDAGDIWASHNFKMRAVSKSNLYRHEVTQAAITSILQAVQNFENKDYKPEPLSYSNPAIKGKLHQAIKTKDRKIDWNDNSDVIVKRIKGADSTPGVLDQLFNEDYRLFGVHKEGILKGKAGEIIAQRHGAICRVTGDGAVWITHLSQHPNGIKLPASTLLQDKMDGIPELDLSPFDTYQNQPTFQEIRYEEIENVGFLHFDFYNGAMSTDQCKRLHNALIETKRKPIKVLVMMGGHDIWSNGIHLNVIENAENKGLESWNNILAIDDLIHEIIATQDKIVVSAMQGNAGAGGVLLAIAADKIFARKGIVLNPHYKKMGGLYGSEYWTYLLPKRVGKQRAHELTELCLPISTFSAKSIGLIDDSFGLNVEEFTSIVIKEALSISNSKDYEELLNKKRAERQKDEAIKPLADYRMHELEQMKINFFGKNSEYHNARYKFVHKIKDADSVCMN